MTKTYKNSQNDRLNAVVMGRKTWESLGKKPLPGRVNIVLSSDTSSENQTTLNIDEEKNTILLSSLQGAVDYCENNEFVNEVFVIGGAKIYEEASKMSDRVKNVFHTRIGQKVKGDTKLTEGLFQGFQIKEISQTYSENGFNFDFVRMINPQLYNIHYDEFNQDIFDRKSGEYAYIDLVDSIIKQGKHLIQIYLLS